jgi:hypothetical protein
LRVCARRLKQPRELRTGQTFVLVFPREPNQKQFPCKRIAPAHPRVTPGALLRHKPLDGVANLPRLFLFIFRARAVQEVNPRADCRRERG